MRKGIWDVGAMLSRPSRNKSCCLDMLAAKACSPGRDSILLRRGTHAFAAGRAPATILFSEGRESMAPTGRQARQLLERIFQIIVPCLGCGCHAFAALHGRVPLHRHAGRESMLPGPRQHPIAAWRTCFRGRQGPGYYPLSRRPRKHGTPLAPYSSTLPFILSPHCQLPKRGDHLVSALG